MIDGMNGNAPKAILFRQDMIDIILAGKKTVTIRPMKPQPTPGSGSLP